MQITCGECNQSSDFDLWLETAAGMKLPPGKFQCPHCNTCIRKKYAKSSYHIIEGKMMTIPGDIALEFCQSYL